VTYVTFNDLDWPLKFTSAI